MKKQSYTVSEAARALGVSRQTIYNWLRDGNIAKNSRGTISDVELEWMRQTRLAEAEMEYNKAKRVEPFV